MFDSYWSAVSSSNSKVTALDCTSARATACAALDLVSCLHNKHLFVFTSDELKVREDEVDVLGAGGFSHVELGSLGPSKESRVAVKRSRLFPRERRPTNDATFERHLAELATEVRILSHEKLRLHRNIVDVVGISINDEGPATFISLVTEYAEIGSLRQFLEHEGKTLPYADRVHLVAQLASGLAAVHSSKIAHGDVKTDNALVFRNDGELHVKLSDFGQSILQPVTDIPGNDSVTPPTGTPLLSAPEIRNGSCNFQACFTIEDAIATDIFSFGLCTWEIIKGGVSFFNNEWLGKEATNNDQDCMISYLNDLPQNQLCLLGFVYLNSLDREVFNDIETIQIVLYCCLQDEPHLRKPISVILGHFGPEHIEVEDLETSDGHKVPAWTFHGSLRHAEGFLRGRSSLFSKMPLAFRRRISEDLEWIADSDAISSNTRAYAALVNADFFASGVDAGKPSTDRVLHWLHRAVELGSLEAAACYDRVCYALGESPLPYKTSTFCPETVYGLSETKEPDYLIHWIHSQNKTYKSRSRHDHLAVAKSMVISRQDEFEMSLFNEDNLDYIGPLHLAAWHAEASIISDILSKPSIFYPDTISTLGLNAAHFAAVGGNNKTLQMLADNGVYVEALTFQRVTALHLAIFIPPDDIDEAISFLVKSGVSTTAESDEILWTMHRLVLSGTPLQWAVLTRNLPMVKALAPHSTESLGECFGVAINHFFLEIAEELLPHCQRHDKMPWVSHEHVHLEKIKDPIAHWIVHGPGHISVIEATVQFCRDNKLLVYGRGPKISHMYFCVEQASCDDDFHLAKSLFEVRPVLNVADIPGDENPLHKAFERSGDDPRWFDVIRVLSGCYTTEQLQQNSPDEVISFFNSALYHGSVIGVQVLLDRGVDVNYAYTPSEYQDPIPCWHYWNMAKKHRRKLLSLLQGHGMHISLTTPNDSRTSAMYDHMVGVTWNRSGFDDFVDLVLSAENAIDILERAIRQVNAAGALLDEELKAKQYHQLDMIRALLKRDMVVAHVNSTLLNIGGRTALHVACDAARPDVVRLLLEAGADPCIPYVEDGDRGLRYYYALQKCVSSGLSISLDWIESLQNSETNDVPPTAPPWDMVALALEAALEVLRSHTVRGEDIFQNVDRNGLVWAMLYVPEMAKIVSESKGICSDDPRATEEYWLNEIKTDGPYVFLWKYRREGSIPEDLDVFKRRGDALLHTSEKHLESRLAVYSQS